MTEINTFRIFLITIINYQYIYGLSLSSTPASSFNVRKVSKVSASDFEVQKHYFHKDTQTGAIYETPVLIENALSPSLSEKLCDSIVHNLGHVTVDVQRKRKNIKDGDITTSTEIFEYSLVEALGLMMESTHDDSFFCFSEGLMDDNIESVDMESGENEEAVLGMKDIKKIFTSTRENLFGYHNDSSDKQKSGNVFDHFPKDVRPSDCVVIAGEGATSTLHRDPFSWTGTSLCLEGTKIWRFIAPPGAMGQQKHVLDGNGSGDDLNKKCNDSFVSCVDNTLKSYRLPSIAWDDGSNQDDTIYLSSGWQSNYSLYSSYKNHGQYPSAEDFASMDEHEKISIIEDLANNMFDLAPNCPNIFSSTSNGMEDNQLSIWTVVQKPGDLLVIPAFWWHQTFALEPSLAIASQRCDRERDCERVLKYIISQPNKNVKRRSESAHFLCLIIHDVIPSSKPICSCRIVSFV